MIQNTPSRPVFIYARVSTARQANEGVGLEFQETKCREFVAKDPQLGPVLEVFRDEGISGRESLENRPGLAKLVKASLLNRDAIVVVYTVSRLARRQKLFWQLLDTRDGFGLPLKSATENFDTSTPIGVAMLGMLGVFAQLFADMNVVATRDALSEVKQQVQRGEHKPLGRPTIAQSAPEGVRIAKELRAQGLTQKEIALQLDRRGVPLPTGATKWNISTVQRALNVLEMP